MLKHLRPLLCLMPLLGLLAACGEPDPAKLNQKIDAGDYTGVLNNLDAAIESSPTSPVYHLLAVRAQLMRCAHVEGGCQGLGSLPSHVTYTVEPISLATGGQMSLGGVLNEALPALARLPQPPLTDLLKTFPANRREVLIGSFFHAAATLLLANEVSASSHMLGTLANTDTVAEPARSWAGAASASLKNDTSRKQSYFIALKSQKETLSRPAQALAPLVIYTDLPASVSRTQLFISTLSDTLAGWRSPALTPTNAGPGIADGLNRMRQSSDFVAQALATWPKSAKTSIVTDLSPTVPLSDPGVTLQLALTRLSLLFNPNQPALLGDFMGLATRTLETSGTDMPNTDLIGDISLESLPADVQAALVDKLFTLLEAQQASNQSLTPLLLPLATLKLDKANSTRLEKFLQVALEQAIAAKQASVVLALAEARPTLAQNNRQLIAPLLADDIREHLKTRDFSTVTEVANFLTDKMGVSFNLDALILEGLVEDFKSGEVATKLTANSAEWLLKPAEDVAFDLGPYWYFVQDHFAGKPAVINNQLRALVAAVGGTYGPATAMWRLDQEFEDVEFSTEEREDYINQAIQSALLNDHSLAPGDLLDLAGRLVQTHPGLPLTHVVEDALNRATTLDDSRAIWQASSPEARKIIQNVRPQFAALMRGIDAFNKKQYAVASKEFTHITDAAYRDELMPYFDELEIRLAAVTGMYINIAPSSTLPTASIAIIADALASDEKTAPLDQLTLVLVNRLGSLIQNDAATLGTDRGSVLRLPVRTAFDLNNNRMLLTAALDAPTNLSESSERLFGNIDTLTFMPPAKGEPAQLLAKLKGQQTPVKLVRVQADPQAALMPKGRYLLSQPLTALSNLLPPGLLLEITSTPGSSNIGVRLQHPGLNTVQELDAHFDASTHMMSTTFKAPLPQGGNVPAALRCQFLNTVVICGAHYLNQPRKAYATLLAGNMTRETATAQAVAWQAADDVYQSSHKGSNSLLGRLTTTRQPKISLPVPSLTVSESSNISSTEAVSASEVISSSSMGYGGALVGLGAVPTSVPASTGSSTSSTAPVSTTEP